MKLSDMPTTTRPPQSSMNTAAPIRPWAKRTMAAGTHTAAVPGTGRSAATAASTPKTTTEGRPTSKKPMPTSAPWTAAVTMEPRATPRVTAAMCPARLSFRRGSSGIKREVAATITSQSRRKKKMRKSVMSMLKRVPRALAKRLPLVTTKRPRRALVASMAAAWSCVVSTGRKSLSHSRTRWTMGRFKRSLVCETLYRSARACRRPIRSAACRPKTTASMPMGASTNRKPATVSIMAATPRRPPSLRVRRSLRGLRRKARSAAHTMDSTKGRRTSKSPMARRAAAATQKTRR